MKQQGRLGKLIKSAEFGIAREGIKISVVGRTTLGNHLANGLLGG